MNDKYQRSLSGLVSLRSRVTYKSTHLIDESLRPLCVTPCFLQLHLSVTFKSFPCFIQKNALATKGPLFLPFSFRMLQISTNIDVAIRHEG